MPPAELSVELVSWERSYRLACRLSEQIQDSGFIPDLVVAIGRGGYVPARTVCDLLGMMQLSDIKIEHWGAAGEKKEQAVIRYPLVAEVLDKRVLVIDDLTDTGDTLALALRHIRERGPAETRAGVLQHKQVSGCVPDYRAETIREWRWVTYPWALHEDLVGFVRKTLEGRMLSTEALKRALDERYGIRPGEEDLARAVREVLQGYGDG